MTTPAQPLTPEPLTEKEIATLLRGHCPESGHNRSECLTCRFLSTIEAERARHQEEAAGLRGQIDDFEKKALKNQQDDYAHYQSRIDAQAEEIAGLTERIRQDNAFCICGCPDSEHDGEACENEHHECIRVCAAALNIANALRSDVKNLTAGYHRRGEELNTQYHELVEAKAEIRGERERIWKRLTRARADGDFGPIFNLALELAQPSRDKLAGIIRRLRGHRHALRAALASKDEEISWKTTALDNLSTQFNAREKEHDTEASTLRAALTVDLQTFEAIRDTATTEPLSSLIGAGPQVLAGRLLAIRRAAAEACEAHAKRIRKALGGGPEAKSATCPHILSDGEQAHLELMTGGTWLCGKPLPCPEHPEAGR